MGPTIYAEFVWPFEKQLVDRIRAMGAKTRLHICGNTSPILGPMGRLGCDIVDLDYPASVRAARTAMGPDQLLLGNLDPVRVVRAGTPESIAVGWPNVIVRPGRDMHGAGCELPRDTSPENVAALSSYARGHGARELV